MASVENDFGVDRRAANDPHLPHPKGPTPEGPPTAFTRPPLPADFTSPVIDGVEDPEDWERYRAGTLTALGPVGFVEVELAEIIALLSWRLRRVGRLEAEALADGFVRQNEAVPESSGRGRPGGCERVLAVFCRYEGRIERARDRAVKELRGFQQARKAAGPVMLGSAIAQPTRKPQGPGTEAPGSFGKNTDTSTSDPALASPGPSGTLGSFGQTASAAASSGPETADAAEAGALGSFGPTTTPRPNDPVAAASDPSGALAPFGQTPTGSVGSFGQTACSAVAGAPPARSTKAPTRTSRQPAPRPGPVGRPLQPAFRPQPEYVEEGAQEDAWTYSSYKAYWAERDAADRAARLGLPVPGNPDLEVIDEPGP